MSETEIYYGTVTYNQNYEAMHGKAHKSATHLINVIVAREVRFPSKQLGKDATDGPNIDRLGILMARQHNLRSAVPPRDHIFRQQQRVAGLANHLLVAQHASGQTKVTDLEVAVGIDEQIRRLEVAVQHVGRMDVLESAEDLVQEVLRVVDR